MRTITRDIVGAVLISSDGKILLGRTAHDAGGVYLGTWVIPGGGIDDGETREQAVIREVKEETHHDISNLEISLIGDSAKGESEKILKDTKERVLVKMNFIEFKVVFPQSADELGVLPTEELVELQWFSPDELSDITIAPPTKALFIRMNIL